MRRAILWTLAVAGLAIAVLGIVGCGDCKVEKRVEETFEPDPIKPHKLPLLVDADHMLDSRVLRDAVDVYDLGDGCKLLKVGSPADVFIDFDRPPTKSDGTKTDCGKRCDPDNHVACTCFGRDGWRIYYPAPATIDVDLWVVAHELSHVLGLAHDVGRKNAITRPDAHNGPRDHAFFQLTSNDKDALRAAYCPR
jgi:hypothetical protein